MADQVDECSVAAKALLDAEAAAEMVPGDGYDRDHSVTRLSAVSAAIEDVMNMGVAGLTVSQAVAAATHGLVSYFHQSETLDFTEWEVVSAFMATMTRTTLEAIEFELAASDDDEDAQETTH